MSRLKVQLCSYLRPVLEVAYFHGGEHGRFPSQDQATIRKDTHLHQGESVYDEQPRQKQDQPLPEHYDQSTVPTVRGVALPVAAEAQEGVTAEHPKTHQS